MCDMLLHRNAIHEYTIDLHGNLETDVFAADNYQKLKAHIGNLSPFDIFVSLRADGVNPIKQCVIPCQLSHVPASVSDVFSHHRTF